MGVLIVPFVLIASLLWPSAVGAGQSGLAGAKQLYLAASYEEALALLDQIPESDDRGAAIDVMQYRAFCLLALQRAADARTAIEALYSADPTFQVANTQASPRTQAVFVEVRRAKLPDIVQQAYAEAKEAYARKDDRSTTQFDAVLALLDDPDMAGKVLPDFRTVVEGFRDLSKAVRPAPSLPPASTVRVPPGAGSRPSPGPPEAPPVPAPPVIVPPVALTRSMPAWHPSDPADRARVFSGEVQVDVNERGDVMSAVMITSVNPVYDRLLLRAAREWTFTPGTRGGVASPFVVNVRIRLQGQ